MKEKTPATDELMAWLKANTTPDNIAFAKNGERYDKMLDIMCSLTKLIKEHSPDAKIEIKTCGINPCSVYYKAVASQMIAYDTTEFAELIKYAANFEVYPRTDNALAFSALFNDMYVPFEKGGPFPEYK